MNRGLLAALATALLLLLSASPAQAAFGLQGFQLQLGQSGLPAEAGSHPSGVVNTFSLNTATGAEGKLVPDGELRNLKLSLPAGLVGDPSAVPPCPDASFTQLGGQPPVPQCSDSSVIGTVVVLARLYTGEVTYLSAPVYSIAAGPGTVQKAGFSVLGLVPVIITFEVNHQQPYNVVARLENTSQVAQFFSAQVTLWGVPASPVHDSERGSCVNSFTGLTEQRLALIKGCKNKSTSPEVPYITLPTSCGTLPFTSFLASSWDGAAVNGGATSERIVGCERLRFSPTISASPTTKAAQSPTGLDFSLDVADEGIENPEGKSQSDIRKAEVTLPEGFTTNPSLAEGLTTCTEADLGREAVDSLPGEGCPNESKIGTVEVETPLLEESVDGSLFVATPYENQAENSLLGLYMVIRNPKLGIIIKQPLKVEPNPVTGQLTAVAEEIPQLPFSHFKLHFREGTRSPLASPPTCGDFAASAVLTPWSGGAPITTSSMFSIISGPDSGSCPTGGTPPFHPGLEAGTVNNAAGSYSPFYLHLTRNDGEQEITHFSIKLPPGVIGKLAGIPFCSDAAIAAATARTGPHGGQEEIEHPSCPAASEVGHTLVGAGVGPSLAYAPGKIYLAGPYHGSQLSLVSVTAAKVGPFDLGTVVIRFALRVNPETAEVFVDAAGSDPIPHIIKGIPIHLRDIRAYVDRPNFVLNPTSCERTSTASTVLGSGTNLASEADDQPITVTSPFQAASCASLGFKPRLALSLKGGTKRNANPALTAVVTPRQGDANIGQARVTLPHSEFLDQGHIKTICTRVQFNAGGGNGEQCPKGSVYGRAKAITPLLSEPLTGPVYLRSSSHKLPDLVAALHSGEINIDLDGRIDSAKGGRIRNTFEAVPDAPVTKFTLSLFGGKKSLLVNSTNICKGSHKAVAEFTGQNGKQHDFGPALKAQCGKKAKKGKAGAKGKKGSKSSALGLVDLGW
jgi:hypothetical protein